MKTFVYQDVNRKWFIQSAFNAISAEVTKENIQGMGYQFVEFDSIDDVPDKKTQSSWKINGVTLEFDPTVNDYLEDAKRKVKYLLDDFMSVNVSYDGKEYQFDNELEWQVFFESVLSAGELSMITVHDIDSNEISLTKTQAQTLVGKVIAGRNLVVRAYNHMIREMSKLPDPRTVNFNAREVIQTELARLKLL